MMPVAPGELSPHLKGAAAMKEDPDDSKPDRDPTPTLGETLSDLGTYVPGMSPSRSSDDGDDEGKKD